MLSLTLVVVGVHQLDDFCIIYIQIFTEMELCAICECYITTDVTLFTRTHFGSQVNTQGVARGAIGFKQVPDLIEVSLDHYS